MKLLQFVNKENIISNNNGALKLDDICKELQDDYKSISRKMKVLIDKEIILKHNEKYLMNPFVFSKSSMLNLSLLRLFENTIWKKILFPNSVSRNSYEYAVWETEVKSKNECRCIACNSDLQIEAHHIFPFANYPNLRTEKSNGVPLCRMHHAVSVKGSFHNLYGTVNNTPEQLQEYINLKRIKYNLPPISIFDI